MGFMVFQVQLTKKVDALPLTRDYIPDTEKHLRNREQTLEADPDKRMRA